MWTLVDFDEYLSQPWAADYLKALEIGLRATATCEDRLITEAANHLIVAGGKRIRPLISFSVAAALGSCPSLTPKDPIVQGAIAVELVHLASLYHDDVMDEASERRGTESVNSRFGNLIAIVTGDFLLAKAAEIAARLGSEVAELLANTLGRMCEGQILEVGSAFDTSRTVDQYLKSVAGKTASLMATSARIPAIIHGVASNAADAITTIGENLGMIFQLRDDVLDLLGSKERLRKEPGQDLIEGIYTLPVLLALKTSDSSEDLRAILGHKIEADAESIEIRKRVIEFVKQSAVLDEVMTVLRGYANMNWTLQESIGSYDLEWLVRLGQALVDDTEKLIIASK
jgi:heptaprenyl diphosphate synthase